MQDTQQLLFGPKKLGFGMMRLPMIKGENGAPDTVDTAQVCRMVDEFMKKGCCYFDTAHGYLNELSELAVRDCLTSRYPRESYRLTDKLSGNYFKTEADIRPLLLSQLKACGVEYFDIYLLHSITADNYAHFCDCNAFAVVQGLKEEGLVRHIGFSFHDKPEFLRRLLTEHPEIEVVQIQFNYADFEDPGVQSRAVYEVCREFGKPVIVMEPVKGGTLATVPAKAESLMRAQHPDWSIASWALRFVSDLPAVFMILSGMSNLQQVKDNIHTFDTFSPLSAEEVNTLQNVVKIIQGKDSIACTGCHYCTDGCPKKILIPDYFSLYNTFLKEGQNQEFFSKEYENISSGHGKAGDCIACRKCEKSCPQHLPIVEDLKKVKKYFE